jgi:dTDP-4-amino-4,6-dideoxygalactose transaminase
VKVPFLDLSRQTAGLRTELDSALAQLLDESRFVFGSAVAEFETRFARYCGAGHAVGVGSGTDAIAIALRAVGVTPGDEVITAANTCVPTAAGIEAAGAVPVLVDADPETYTLDPGALANAVTERTRAVVPVHLYGRCAAMDAIVQIARRHGLKVVEDAAHAHGASYSGRRTGTLGDAAAFSFYPTKNLGALGDAGAVVTDDPAVAEEARLLRNLGEREGNASVRAGGHSRLDTVQAAVLLAKLPHLDAWTARRRALASLYRRALSGTGLELPADSPNGAHVHHLFVVRAPRRDDLRRRLASEGVETRIHYPRPLHLHPAYERLARAGTLPASERLAGEILSLPLYPELTDGEISLVADAVYRALPLVA